MSVMDVTARIAQIQSQLALLTPATSSTSAASGTFSLGLQTAGRVSAGATTTAAATGDQVVEDARQYLGVPYVWGGTDPAKGLDCSGLVQRVYGDLGIDLPRVSRDQAQVGTAVPSLDQAQPGDLLAFGSPVHHIAIYIGDGKMIEAPRPGLDVRVSDVYETPSAIRRVVQNVHATPVSDPSAVPTTSLAMTSAAPTASTGTVSGVPYADQFNQAGAEYGVDARLLAAVARQESGFDPSAVSPAGAQGLMQLMPSTAAGLGVTNSFDPTQAVDGAAKLLSELLQRFGSTPLALAAYNAGPGAVLKYAGVPPYPETQNYVKSVMSMVGES